MVLPNRGHLLPCHHQAQRGASQSEGTSYCDGDVRNRLLRYQLNIAIEDRDHARRIATLSTNMLSKVVAHVMGDEEVHDLTRQGSTK